MDDDSAAPMLIRFGVFEAGTRVRRRCASRAFDGCVGVRTRF